MGNDAVIYSVRKAIKELNELTKLKEDANKVQVTKGIKLATNQSK